MHLVVPVSLPDGSAATRRYPITSDSRRSDAYEIAVPREDESSGGSVNAHEQFRLRPVSHCGLPRNDFPLDEGAARRG